MSPLVNTDDLMDAHGVAELLGLSHPNSVSTYQRRYPDMPRPIVRLGSGKTLLWLRPEIEAWAMRRGRPGSTAGRASGRAGSQDPPEL